MANKNLFQRLRGALVPKADAVNAAGGKAYALPPKHALAIFAATGCLNSTFYASAENQLQTVLDLARDVKPEFLAQTAIYTRKRGLMKDMPALLCAQLALLDGPLLARVFPRVIDNGKMLRNFVQILRSGVVGRRSLGSLPKRLVRQWLDARADQALFRDSVGRSPSLPDIVKMVHPKPPTPGREALYGYLLGREHDASLLPPLVQHFEAFKAAVAQPMSRAERRKLEVPDVPFQMLTALDFGTREWMQIARQAPWQMTRMNLNTFARHGVFAQPEMVRMVAERLRDPQAIARARVFPYQLLTACQMASPEVPAEVREALHDAMEVATRNVPNLPGKVYILPDVSGSMGSPVTGFRKGATSKVRCVDVAALVAASILRKNRSAEVLPFEHQVVQVQVTARDSVMTNAAKLAAIGGGGTNCSAPLALLNKRRAKGNLVVFVSDNESWVDRRYGRGTETMVQWNAFKKRNPRARLVCIDLQPNRTTQAPERDDVLNIGGFSDQVFELLAAFARGGLHPDHWIGVIEAIEV